MTVCLGNFGLVGWPPIKKTMLHFSYSGHMGIVYVTAKPYLLVITACSNKTLMGEKLDQIKKQGGLILKYDQINAKEYKERK